MCDYYCDTDFFVFHQNLEQVIRDLVTENADLQSRLDQLQQELECRSLVQVSEVL